MGRLRGGHFPARCWCCIVIWCSRSRRSCAGVLWANWTARWTRRVQRPVRLHLTCARAPCRHRGRSCRVYFGVEQRPDRGTRQPAEVPQASGLWPCWVRPVPATRPAVGGVMKAKFSTNRRKRKPFTQSAAEPRTVSRVLGAIYTHRRPPWRQPQENSCHG